MSCLLVSLLILWELLFFDLLISIFAFYELDVIN